MPIAQLLQNLHDHIALNRGLEFAEAIAPTHGISQLWAISFDETGLQLKSILETAYTDGVTGLEGVNVNGNEITGVFLDQISPNTIKRYSFTITSDNISYQLENPDDVDEADFTELEFATAAKQKNCAKGTACGNTCIAKGRKCNQKPSPDTQQVIQQVVAKAPKFAKSSASKTKKNAPLKDNQADNTKPSDEPNYVLKDKLAAARKELIDFLGGDAEVLISAAEKQVQSLIDDSDILIRVPDNKILEKIISGGRFKSQFETGTSQGVLQQDFRKDAENEMFGYGDIPASDRPIYGYFGHPSDRSQDGANVNLYGSIAVKLKKTTAKRVTITGNDSLNDTEEIGVGKRYQPCASNSVNLASMLNPDWVANAKEAIKAGESIESYRDQIKAIAQLKNIGEARKTFGYYLEAQIHKGVTTEDIEEIVYIAPPKSPRRMKGGSNAQVQVSPKVSKWAKQNSVKITT